MRFQKIPFHFDSRDKIDEPVRIVRTLLPALILLLFILELFCLFGTILGNIASLVFGLHRWADMTLRFLNTFDRLLFKERCITLFSCMHQLTVCIAAMESITCKSIKTCFLLTSSLGAFADERFSNRGAFDGRSRAAPEEEEEVPKLPPTLPPPPTAVIKSVSLFTWPDNYGKQSEDPQRSTRKIAPDSSDASHLWIPSQQSVGLLLQAAVRT